MVNIIIINITWISNAYAYFDYGTGSLLIQSMIAGFGAIIMFFNRIKHYLHSLFCKIFFRKEKQILPHDDLKNNDEVI
ncbi:hypothetical protein [Legionella fairfieldensis]|uniref:hypothetical protein n=1 Tax=Legionella fairfieldensis TaxID=45064 RepID=UPI0010415EDF|nr:hypothetical protein [Legionella fairfieldensis]